MPSTEVIKVMLVDDHPIVLRGLREALEDWNEFEVVGQAADGEEAIRVAQEARPHVIVMDVLMPEKDGVEACRDIMELLPDTKVLMLTASNEDDAVVAAIAAGSIGFLPKYSRSDELVDAIRNAYAGNLTIPDQTMRRIFRVMRNGTRLKSGPDVLASREREVLTQFAEGKSYGSIAQTLGVSAVTVRNTIYRVQGKLGMGSKQEMVVWAVRNGLLDDAVKDV